MVCGRAEPTQNKDIGWSALISRRKEKEKLELQVFAGVLRKDFVIRENDGREPEGGGGGGEEEEKIETRPAEHEIQKASANGERGASKS